MFRSALIITVVGFLPLAACSREPPPHAPAAVATRPPDPPPTVEAPPLDPFTGKTRLHYEESHGNQIVYQDPSGRFFLWYPGNRGVIAGDWVAEAQRVCYRYDNEETYNPVTAEYSSGWECRSWFKEGRYVVDAVPGDVFGLATGRVPFRLPAQPRFESIADVKAPP